MTQEEAKAIYEVAKEAAKIAHRQVCQADGTGNATLTAKAEAHYQKCLEAQKEAFKVYMETD